MANKKISELNAITTIANDDVLPIVDLSETETKKVSYNQLTGGATQTEIGYLSGLSKNAQEQFNEKAMDTYVKTGWYPISSTLTYSSADAPTFVATTSVDLTNILSVGMKIKYTQGGVVKFGILTAITASTITLYGGTDYVLTNATISNVYFSNVKAPFGFPINPDKWTIVFTDSSNRTQSSPVGSTWYNIGNLSFYLSIGAWKVSYHLFGVVSTTTIPGYGGIYFGLATTNLSPITETKSKILAASVPTYGYMGGSLQRNDINFNVSVKTLIYLNLMQEGTASFFGYDSSQSPILIKAVCAYL